MKLDVDRSLLAYIQKEDSTIVLIDIVETTKNGLSFRLNGEIWNRGHRFIDQDKCRNQDGIVWRIAPLNRHSTPRWVSESEIQVCAAAAVRYHLWLGKKLRVSNLTKHRT
jgi:hypothetical protein